MRPRLPRQRHGSRGIPASLFPSDSYYVLMKAGIIALLSLALVLPLSAETKRQRKSLLNSDPDVIYLADILREPIQLKVIKEAAVFSDKEGRQRLGFLKANQSVELEGMTEKAYRVRGMGKTKNGIVGWVGPHAFSHPQEDFVAKLKQLYERQMAVNGIIAEKGVAIGMTLGEVEKSRGKPTKTSVRRTAKGEAGSWEYIVYEEVKHYVTRIDPLSRRAFRQFSHVTREETGKTVVEFEDGLVTALQEEENKGSGNVRIVVPPLVFGW